jgi:PAS domain S-box-containing protein
LQGEFGPLKLLLVDDREENLLALEAVLSSSNYQFVKASSGPEALAAIDQHGFFAILLDIQMPIMDGFETARRIRQTQNGRDVPIVFVTALDRDPKYIELGYKIGAVDYVFKPYEPIALRVKVSLFATLYQKSQALLSSKRELEQSETRFRLLVQGVKDYAIFMLDPKGHISSWNEGAKRNKGYEAAEILGKHFSVFYPKEVAEAGHPERELELATKEGQYEEEGWRVRKDGSRFWASVLITAIRDEHGVLLGFSKVVRDLTERRSAERARMEELRKEATLKQVQENEKILDQIFSEAPSFMTLLGVPDYRYLKSNAQHLKLIRKSGILGRTIREVQPELESQGILQLLDAVAETGKPFVGKEVPIHYAATSDEGPKTAYLDFVYQPLKRPTGEVYAIAVQGHEVTEKVLSRRAVENERENFRNLFRQTPEMVCILKGPDHVFEFVNQAHIKALGFDATGRSVRQAQPESVEVHGILDDVYRTGKTAELHEIAITLSGRLRRFNLTYAARRDEAGEINGVMVLGVEVTDQVAAREQLRASQERATVLAEASTLLASSLDYRVALTELARLSVPLLADWCTITIAHEEKPADRVAIIHRDPSKGAMIEELNARYAADDDKAGGIARVIETGNPLFTPVVADSDLAAAARDERHLEIMRELGCRSCIVVPIHARGKVLGAIAFVSNQADRVYSENDLALAEELGNRAGIAIDNAFLYESAQKAVLTRDEFMSIASHELKTPITSLMLQLQIARKRTQPELGVVPPPEKLAKTLDASISQVNRLTSLVDDLLDVSRIQAGKLSISLEPVDIAALVHEMVERYGEHMRSAGCRVSVRAPHPVWVSADKFRLEQVIINLLSNAAKYGAGKPVELSVAETADQRVRIACRDHGIGIPEEKLARIFERFERAIDSSAISGLGLGLYIAREIVRAHHGTIRVESVLDRGSTFTVELEKAVTEASETSASTELSESLAGPLPSQGASC